MIHGHLSSFTNMVRQSGDRVVTLRFGADWRWDGGGEVSEWLEAFRSAEHPPKIPPPTPQPITGTASMVLSGKWRWLSKPSG